MLLGLITNTEAVNLHKHHHHHSNRSNPGVRFELLNIDTDDKMSFNGMIADPDIVLDALPELSPVSNYAYVKEDKEM